jgi:CubicO group peptidase (beta-lactamase class C family)
VAPFRAQRRARSHRELIRAPVLFAWRRRPLSRIAVAVALAVAAFVSPRASAQSRLSDSSDVDTYLEHTVETTKIPGVVAMVADGDHILYSGAFGNRDVANHAPMMVDSIFRIASMTKPVTSVAVIMLVEKGAIALDDPIAKYLPAFERPQVFLTFDPKDKSFTKRPASTDITVRQLLTHTSGLGYAFDSPILAALVGGDPNASATSYPLLFDPGTKWTYGESTRVLGKLVEEVSHQPHDRFVAERIFKPLGMNDTFYVVPKAKHDRVVTVHRTTDQGLVETPNPETIDAPANGDGGLHSTAADYVKFMQMLLHEGRAPDGTQLLRAESVKLMSRTQTGNVKVELMPTTNDALSKPFPLGAGRDTFGLGFEITNAPGDPGMRTPGSLSWAGIFNTEFWIDPQRGICAVLLMQYLPFYDPAAIDTLQGFERRVYTGLAR